MRKGSNRLLLGYFGNYPEDTPGKKFKSNLKGNSLKGDTANQAVFPITSEKKVMFSRFFCATMWRATFFSLSMKRRKVRIRNDAVPGGP